MGHLSRAEPKRHPVPFEGRFRGVRVSQRIIEAQADLPPAERRVAELVLADTRAVAFGTVASAKACSSFAPRRTTPSHS